ncbi:MAG TPA: OsmC family protein [Steroidobacteraceae bacterium]|jgi:putative redox protein|nr:OsmC family protein [Steroidobacteraceae bacterium]
MAHATADIGTINYATALVAGHHTLTADEGAALGGQDTGAAPHELLCAALAACTAITLRMYAGRKGWPLAAAHVDVLFRLEGDKRLMTRRLRLEGELDEAQRARLADIAERTPVTLTLKQGVAITTTLEPTAPA